MKPVLTEMVLQLATTQYRALGPVRCLPGLLAAADSHYIWVRGIPVSDKPHLLIQQLPTLCTWYLDDHNRLFKKGSLTPTDTLNTSLSWKPLPQLLEIELPVSLLPQPILQQYPVKLVPSAKALEVTALLTSLDTWYSYAATAPLSRLQRLTFAANAQGRVLICGTPLPAIPGQAYVQTQQLLLPAGFDFDPPGIKALVAQQLDPQQEHQLLFDTAGNWERIPQHAFVQASRRGIRATQSDPA
ncbi:hypothetical protein [Chitinophaga sp. HK235]|uniref:hypothetical protein n=1 Tax=Chitinophaga sp. HK235 TaxID=2952571 RepID=UPI001BA50850|nr:hypothetical protein [Chitinophaga sp. HK235]